MGDRIELQSQRAGSAIDGQPDKAALTFDARPLASTSEIRTKTSACGLSVAWANSATGTPTTSTGASARGR